MISRIRCFLCALVVSSGIFAPDIMTVVERPQGIKNQMAQCGMQDQAAPTVAILEPKEDAKRTTREISVVK